MSVDADFLRHAKAHTIRSMLKLEARDYRDIHPNQANLVEHFKRRDRIQYFMLQMRDFWDREPWDLPPSYNGSSTYRIQDLDTLPIVGRSDLEALHELLTGLEAEVILAAQRRGIRLKRRPCDVDSGSGRRGHARKRGGGGGFER